MNGVASDIATLSFSGTDLAKRTVGADDLSLAGIRKGTGFRLALFGTLCLPCPACSAELSQRLALRQRAAGPGSSMSRRSATAHHPGGVMSRARAAATVGSLAR